MPLPAVLRRPTLRVFPLLLFIAAVAHAADTPTATEQAARLNNVGVAYMSQQLGEKALAHFQQAIAADRSLAVPHLNAGIALLSLQRLNEARTELDQAARLAPDNPRVWYNLGLLDRELSDRPASAQAFDHVLKLDTANADAHYYLASLALDDKDYARAVSEFQRALAINPMHPSAEFGLARALQRDGKPDEARVHLARFQHITQAKLAPVLAASYGEQGLDSLAEEITLATPPVAAMIPITLTAAALEPSTAQSAAAPDGNNAPGGGMCLIDIDGHGRPDLVTLNTGEHAISLYRHSESGIFTQVSAQKLGLSAQGHAIACAVGDFDNDGQPDLAIAFSDRIALYHNLGNGSFADVTEKSGIRSLNSPAALTFVDFDHDGDLDLLITGSPRGQSTGNVLWRNNGNQTFTEWSEPTGLGGAVSTTTAMLSDLNNDRAVDLAITGGANGVTLYMNPREGKFTAVPLYGASPDLAPAVGLAVVDYNKDGWMDIAVTHAGTPGVSLWRNVDGKRFERVPLPLKDVKRAWGITPIDIDNDGWIDLAAAVETSRGAELRVLRNMGPAGFEDVTSRLHLDHPLAAGARSVVAVDADGDGDADLLVGSLHGAPTLYRNDGGNRNHSIQLVLHGGADNKTALGTKVEVFADGLWQKWEVAGAGGYLSQGGTSILAGLGTATTPDVVRMLWPTGVPQDELNLTAQSARDIQELDRRGSSCPVLFAWNGSRYQFVTDTVGAAVVGHWVAPHKRNTPDPDEWIKVDGSQLQSHGGYLSLRLGEPMEEVNYIDQVRLIAIDHPAGSQVFPNERFKNDPPFAETKTIFTRQAHPPAGAWDDKGRDVVALLRTRDHQYVRDFTNLAYAGFATPHTLSLDLAAWSPDQPLRLLLHGFIEYFSASSLYSAWQAGIRPISPYIEAQLPDGRWKRVVEDMGFPAGLPRTIVADLTGKLPAGTRRIRITTNLQIYWDQVLISNEAEHPELVRQTEAPLAAATLGFRGYPRQVDGATPGDLNYFYDQASATGPFIAQRGRYTRYGSVTPLLASADNRFVVFGTGEDIDLEFRESALPPLPAGWQRDYFFYANGFVKDMDYYEAMPFTVADLPFHGMSSYPYPPSERFPDGKASLNYQLEWNNRWQSGDSHPHGFNYQARHAEPLTPPR